MLSSQLARHARPSGLQETLRLQRPGSGLPVSAPGEGKQSFHSWKIPDCVPPRGGVPPRTRMSVHRGCPGGDPSEGCGPNGPYPVSHWVLDRTVVQQTLTKHLGAGNAEVNEAGGSLALQHLAVGRRMGRLQGSGCLPASGQGRGRLDGPGGWDWGRSLLPGARTWQVCGRVGHRGWPCSGGGAPV